ncbi:MAG: DUF6287 domain-containing protein, partial [Lactovum sp.]
SQQSKAESSSNSSTSEETEVKMNLNEIENTNFKSIQGTWKNTKGEGFTILENTMKFSGDTIPSLGDSVNYNQEDLQLSIYTDDISPRLEVNGEVGSDNSLITLYFSLAEANTKFSPEAGSLNSMDILEELEGEDFTDTSKDRIYLIHLLPSSWSQNSSYIEETEENFVYYRQ